MLVSYFKKFFVILFCFTFFSAQYNISISAPVKKGNKIGTVEILDENDKLITEGDVTVDKDIKKANFFDYLAMNFKTIIQGK